MGRQGNNNDSSSGGGGWSNDGSGGESSGGWSNDGRRGNNNSSSSRDRGNSLGSSMMNRVERRVKSQVNYQINRTIDRGIRGAMNGGTRMVKEGISGVSNRGGNGGSRGGKGVMPIVLVAVVLLAIVSIATLTLSGSNSGVTASSYERTAIAPAKEVAYYYDGLGWIKNSSKLEKGMKHFYKETGVQPVLYLMSDLNGEDHPDSSTVMSELQRVYTNTMPDQSHMLVMFMEDSSGNWGSWVYAGETAATVMDAEAQDIFSQYLSKWYNMPSSKVTEEEVFSNTFRDTADRIMTKTTPPYVVFLGVGIVVLLVVVVGVVVVKKASLRKEEALSHERILNTDLDDL